MFGPTEMWSNKIGKFLATQILVKVTGERLTVGL